MAISRRNPISYGGASIVSLPGLGALTIGTGPAKAQARTASIVAAAMQRMEFDPISVELRVGDVIK